MAYKLDTKAVYDARTERIRLGDGRSVHVRDLFDALTKQNALTLRSILQRSGCMTGVRDPLEHPRARVVEDLIHISRSLPQYVQPIILAALDIDNSREAFLGLLKASQIGTKASGDHGYTRPEPLWLHQVGQFFYETRKSDGDYSLFIPPDRAFITWTPGDEPPHESHWDESFLVWRSPQRRFFLRWPASHLWVPAFWIDEMDEAVPFFPNDDGDGEIDFEEIYPGWTYEVWGAQFRVPDIGTDYRDWEGWARAAQGAQAEKGMAGKGTPERKRELLFILEAQGLTFEDERALSKHFRKLSGKYHPLKHLTAPEDEREEIAAFYLKLTNAYNELKGYYRET